MSNLIGKKYLVTGGTTGIGLEVCKKLLVAGACVYSSSRNLSKYKENLHLWAVQKGFESNVSWLQMDFQSENAFENVYLDLPAVDGVINCAGISAVAPLKLMRQDQIFDVLKINLIAPIELIRTLLTQRKINKNSSLVFVSSINGTTTGSKGHTVYAAAKGGINGFVMSLSNELSKQMIRVNAIAPGLVKTDLYKSVANLVSSAQMTSHSEKYPLGEGQSANVADLAVFLIGDESKWITGQTIIIDGGFSIT